MILVQQTEKKNRQLESSRNIFFWKAFLSFFFFFIKRAQKYPVFFFPRRIKKKQLEKILQLKNENTKESGKVEKLLKKNQNFDTQNTFLYF